MSTSLSKRLKKLAPIIKEQPSSGFRIGKIKEVIEIIKSEKSIPEDLITVVNKYLDCENYILNSEGLYCLNYKENCYLDSAILVLEMRIDELRSTKIECLSLDIEDDEEIEKRDKEIDKKNNAVLFHSSPSKNMEKKQCFNVNLLEKQFYPNKRDFFYPAL